MVQNKLFFQNFAQFSVYFKLNSVVIVEGRMGFEIYFPHFIVEWYLCFMLYGSELAEQIQIFCLGIFFYCSSLFINFTAVIPSITGMFMSMKIKSYCKLFYKIWFIASYPFKDLSIFRSKCFWREKFSIFSRLI